MPPWCELTRQRDGSKVLDGAVSPSGRVFGTYVHGLFDSLPFTASLIDRLRNCADCRRSLPRGGKLTARPWRAVTPTLPTCCAAPRPRARVAGA